MQMAHINTCGDCALRQNGICAIFQEAVESAQSACVKFTTELFTCELCGGTILPGNRLFDIGMDNDHHHSGEIAQ